MGKLWCVAPQGDRCGEAATWAAQERALYWCDVNRYLVHRIGPDRSVRSWFFDEPVTALAQTTDPGEWIVALGSRLILWRPDGRLAAASTGFAARTGPRRAPQRRPRGAQRRLLDRLDGPQHRPRRPGARVSSRAWPALACPAGRDRDGGEARPGHLQHRLLVARRSAPSISATAWQNTIWAYDYDPQTGEIANERPFFAGFDRGGPDGSAVDSEGRLWNCRFYGGCVVCVAPDGKIEQVIDMPVRDITTRAFGGDDLKTLYITTAGMMNHEGDRLAGSLFALETDAPGLEGYRTRVELMEAVR